MSRFISIFGLVLVILGFSLHFQVELPSWGGWIGNLPGDMIIKKEDLEIYVPLTTSLLISGTVALVLSLFLKPAK